MSIKIKSKNTRIKRLLEDPDPILWKEAEEAEKKQNKFIAELSRTRVKYLTEKLYEIQKKLGKEANYDQEYHKLRDELISLCQKGFLGLGLTLNDKDWVNEALNCLLVLYKPLITRIASNFVLKNKAKTKDFDIELEEVEDYARQLFTRLITGDTPWAIKVFMNQEKPSHETKAALSNIDVHIRRKTQEEKLNSLTQTIKEGNNHPDDIKLTRWIMEIAVEQIPEWLNQPVLSYEGWLKFFLYREVRRRQIALSLDLVKSKNKKLRYKRDIEEINKVLQNGELFHQLLSSRQEVLGNLYQDYKNGAYSDERYKHYKGSNFTAYIDKYLTLRLIDLYRRKELVNRHAISLDKVINKTTDIAYTEQDFSEALVNDDLRKLKSILTPNEFTVLTLRMEEWKNTDIAQKLGVGKSRIAQIVKKVREKALDLGFRPS